MNKAVFFVDGHQEKLFLQKVCGSPTIRRIGCNGCSVSTSAIAKRIASQCRLLHGKCYPIIVWVDLENRSVTAKAFASELLKSLIAEGVEDSITVGVADHCIENWILADKQIVESYCSGKIPYPEQFDGYNGKSRIKKLIPDYNETTTGVELLSKCRPSHMVQSPSFKAFYDQLPKDGCRWLMR